MATKSFDDLRQKHPSVDVDTLQFQYDAYKALRKAVCEITVIGTEIDREKVPALLCSTATVDLRNKIGRIQIALSEASIKLRIVQERLARSDIALAQEALEQRLVRADVEIEAENNRLRRARAADRESQKKAP